MHELSITESILSIVLENARKAQADRVTRVSLTMGKLSGVVGDSVRFYFEMLSKGTLAEGAILSIEEPPARLQCRSCSSVFVPEDFDWACPDCHGHGMEIVSGRECSVDSIEVE